LPIPPVSLNDLTVASRSHSIESPTPPAAILVPSSTSFYFESGRAFHALEPKLADREKGEARRSDG
jgi:hypothetical protein